MTKNEKAATFINWWGAVPDMSKPENFMQAFATLDEWVMYGGSATHPSGGQVYIVKGDDARCMADPVTALAALYDAQHGEK